MSRTPSRPRPTLTPRDLAPIVRKLKTVNGRVARAWPGEAEDRQPVHTVYGGAHLFRSDTARKLGELALAALDEHAPDGRHPPRSARLRRSRW
jgi:hypothetical protein